MEQLLLELRDGIFKKGEITACFYGISNNPAKRKTDDTGERGKDYSVLEQMSGYAISFTNQGTEE